MATTSSEPGHDLRIGHGPGLRDGVAIPTSELRERFSRSSGPGGQSVNTTDSKVELRFAPLQSSAFTDDQRSRLAAALSARLIDGDLIIMASEQRSQRQNRVAARERLVAILRRALAPPTADPQANQADPRFPAATAERQEAARLNQVRSRPGPQPRRVGDCWLPVAIELSAVGGSKQRPHICGPAAAEQHR